MSDEEGHVCLAHSGIQAEVTANRRDINDVWATIAQIRWMFAATMLSTVGTLALILWGIISKKAGM